METRCNNRVQNAVIRVEEGRTEASWRSSDSWWNIDSIYPSHCRLVTWKSCVRYRILVSAIASRFCDSNRRHDSVRNRDNREGRSPSALALSSQLRVNRAQFSLWLLESSLCSAKCRLIFLSRCGSTATRKNATPTISNIPTIITKS